MKKFVTLALSAVAVFAGLQARAAITDNMASIAIDPATGATTLTPQWAIGTNLAGFHFMAQDLSLGGGATQFYSITNATIPMGGNPAGFFVYVAASGAATAHLDIGSKLTPDTYSALTSADPDIGYGAINFYFIHHKGTTDYFADIVPGSAVSSAVNDLKPMSGPGGPATVTGVGGYFGLTFAAVNLNYGLNYLYYLRTDPVTGNTLFGNLDPALAGTSADLFDLGMGGFNALTFNGADVGFGLNKMYYLRLDPITGFTVLGMLEPNSSLAQPGKPKDIANLGSVYTTLDFVPGDVGFGAGHFYTTGTVNANFQTVSFAAIADRPLSAGMFTVTPYSSSALPITLTVVHGAATIGTPTAGVFPVTPTAPGLITLQATQAGQLTPVPYEFNMLRQSFVATPSTVAADFNADVKSDIVWSNNSTGDRYLWLMNGTAYGSSALVDTVTTNWSLTTGDFNADGKADLLWSDSISGDRYIWLMNGAQFSASVFIGTVSPLWTVATGDFNADGKTDLLWSNTSTGDRYVWFMNGTTFSSSRFVATVSPVWTVTTGDFNSDGKTDLLWSNTSTGDRYIWLMNGTHFSASVFIGTISPQWTVATGDFNGDGQTDLLWSNSVTGDRYIWLMNGTSLGSSVFLGNIATQWKVGN